ncbi:MAG TPA: replication initiator [Micromonosporaceae bacterium]
MTDLTLPGLTPPVIDRPRPGSRADRMLMPLSKDVLRQMAEQLGVCVRPLAIRRIDRETGVTEVIDIPCGARLAAKCKPCAERNRRLRIQQIREGWHLADEPTVRPEKPSEDVLSLVRVRAHLEFERQALMYQAMTPDERAAQLADLDQAITDIEEALSTCRVRGALTPDRDAKPRRVRSTRRRKDTTPLPRLPVEPRTVGRTYTGRAGRVHRPSTLLTVTLDSYGPVHTASRYRRGGIRPCECGAMHGERDPLLGTPLDPSTYDYRRAALDAIHFARVLDRFWQNLRRAAGWNIQYAGAVELQRRLAPHTHYCVRGTLPRRLVRQVAAATYHQVWWPHFDTPIYSVDRPPVWDADTGGYVDPATRRPLPTWAEALDALDHPDATPAYLVRLGRVDTRGIEAGTKDAERSIRYVTKYLTKDLTEQAAPHSDAQQAHFDRLHAELATLPCSPTCANWLLYGVQPDRPKPGLTPGRCTGKVHQRRTLGFTGRRVLISRQWSGKTLADHRADNRDWIRTILTGAFADHETDPATQPGDPDRYRFQLARPDDPDVPPLAHRLLRAIAERHRWREQLNHARDRLTAVSATPPPAFPAAA